MQLNHIAINTKDLEGLKEFYVRYFSGRANDRYHNTKTGLKTYFITFDSGAKLELMQRPELADRYDENPAVGLTHLAFAVGSREKVDELTQIFVRDGYLLKSAPRETGDGYYESCILDPDGNQVEIIAS